MRSATSGAIATSNQKINIRSSNLTRMYSTCGAAKGN